jgi:hypothetical protein
VNLAEVMDEIAARLDTIPGLRVHAYPPPVLHPPAAVVTYPEEYTYDATYGRGTDTMRLPVIVLVGKIDDRTTRNRIAAWVDSGGAQRFGIEKTEQLTKHTFSTHGTHVSGVEVADGNLDFQLTAGTVQGVSSLRDVYLRDGLTSADFHARATFDPPAYGALTDPAVTISPQHGLALRFQQDATHHSAVILWQNVFFLVPFLNVGVWRATLAGGSFQSRNYGGWPEPLGLNFPFTVEARLTDNVVEVRQWEVGNPPPRWDDPTLARTIDLDTDAGDSVAIPTPTGQGGAGLVAAHLGLDVRSVCRYPLADIYFEQNTASVKATLEAGPAYNAFDTVRVVDVEFDVIEVAGVEHIGATFNLDIIGQGV